MPPFPARKLRRGRCQHGRAPQARRSCPECRQALPREYVEARSRTIVVIGEAQAGKSTWLAAVIRQLARGETAHTIPGLSLHLLGESSRTRHGSLDWPLLDDRLNPPPATVETTPLLISLRLPAGAQRPRSVVFALYDTPGADFAPDRIDRLAPYLGTAAGVVLLLDPTRLPRVRQVIATGPRHAEPALTPPPDLRAVMRRRPRPPVAVALSKLDMVWEMFDDGSPLRQPCPHGRRYIEADGLDVHHEVASWLARWAGPGFVTETAKNFPVHRYFGLSALGPAGTEPGIGVASYRAADPALWLLTRVGALSVARGRQ
jgi:hypothetical protein